MSAGGPSSPKGAHALIFGASGLAGWAVVDQLLKGYPTPSTFSKVTALVNRPLTLAESYWPQPAESSPELQLVSGINLAEGTVENFTKLLRNKVAGVEGVTHVFYSAYKQEDDPANEVDVNTRMLERATGALNTVSPDLSFFVFPGGTKAYGIHLPDKPFKAPFTETMTPLPEPYESELFHGSFRTVLTRASAGRPWTWCEVRPDAIIGFAPNGSAFNLTAHWALYLSLYARIEGKGIEIAFPGTKKAYESLYNEASAGIIARFSIWASLHPEKCGKGECFNIADRAKTESMAERWPALAAYFGLKGTGPVEDPGALSLGYYVKKHAHALEELGFKESQVFKGEFLDTYGFYLDFDRWLSLDKTRSVGFHEECDPNESWFESFGKFREAGMIPD